eukprot:TRINITY_DN9176_c0_g1_i2.p1 TRINITY_DN9176_c0_g1~~TRINITY_DN9176_c0_g1_i2.p1  ORF type:complete len:305 (+),score=67.76 TRINITY_DN9176_c0_g1_i2:124-1038(+)
MCIRDRCVPCDRACAAYQTLESCTGLEAAEPPYVAHAEIQAIAAMCLPGSRWRGFRVQCPQSCRRGAGCLNQLIGARCCAGVAVAPCTSNTGEIRGYGLYATRALEPGTLIIEYKGKCSSYKRWAEHIHELKRARGQVQEWPYIAEELYGMSIFEEEADLLIDASAQGSVARFVNHSCASNCLVEHVVSASEPEQQPRYGVCVVTAEPIEPFQQLSLDYVWYEDYDDDNETTVHVKHEATRLLRVQQPTGEAQHIDDTTLCPQVRCTLLRQAASSVGVECYCCSDRSLNSTGKCSGVIGWGEDP